MNKNQKIEHIDTWKKSGLSKIDYCRQNNLNYLTFIGWFRKYQTVETNHKQPDWIEIPKETSEFTGGNIFLFRISEDWKFEILIRFRNDIS
ncbi:MAG: hypothetical protein H7A24_06230 [Leptospiraceae bacterium]|nr:hypothetical protein [Leptospiraceae bacterium]